MDNESALEVVVVPPVHDLGDQFKVRRALPSRDKRMVGPFVFLDQMGPHVFQPGRGLDVRPHPHICLATVTYLFEGEILHRDSLGSVQPIRPGEVNWMTAGRGIVHSERTGQELRGAGSSLFGLQCWVALPRQHEETAPTFSHTGAHELPLVEGEGASARIVAGSFFGQRSPVPTLSDMFYVDLNLQPGARIAMPAEYSEQALYVVEGELDLGRDGVFAAGQLLVLKPKAAVTLAAHGGKPARVMLLGGEPMDGPRYLSWNFVASSEERIEQAREDWRKMAFPSVPGETEFIPLPETVGRPVRYP
ncbi:pirin family protein [Massilia agilis]|uniref:Pirin family protein n=1 Tax=Massilia agilis TaxID=1811226 RepID=A0ABT2DB88_9BURK|nr:pirin family protein [Massilia agilis]MCS0808588.1 pirin family protein [Massilia agilis]